MLLSIPIFTPAVCRPTRLEVQPKNLVKVPLELMLVAELNHKCLTMPWSGQDGFGSKFLGV